MCTAGYSRCSGGVAASSCCCACRGLLIFLCSYILILVPTVKAFCALIPTFRIAHPSSWKLVGQVYAGANPFVEKVINHLAAGLMDALLNVFTEAKGKVLKVLDVQGYCQLMLEVQSPYMP